MAIRKLPSTGDKPRASATPTGLPTGMVAGGAGDSAGFPWEGRTFNHHDTAFAGDDGTSPKEFVEAIEHLRQAATALTRSPEALAEHGSDKLLKELAQAHANVVLTLNRVRLLVPLVADAGELGYTPEGKIVEKTQELSIVTVKAPDGRTVMPVFSSVDAMRTWDATARPIPVPGPQAAIAAAQEGTELLIVDPGSSATEFGIRSTELEAVALGESQVPAWHNSEVLKAFAQTADGDAIRAVEILPGDAEGRLRAPEIDVVLSVVPGLSRDQLTERIQALQTQWAKNETIAHLVDSLRVRVLAADS